MYSSLSSSVETWKLKCNIKIGGYTKKSDKNSKSKRLQLQEEIEEIRINYFPKKEIEKWSNSNLKNNRISNYGGYLFKYFLICDGTHKKKNVDKIWTWNSF